jgi:hypothetical protein
MLDQSIQEDMAQQNADLSRKQAALDAKGRRMDQQHERGFARLKDREAQELQRLTGMEKYLMAKARVPGPEGQRAAYLAVAQDIANKKMGLVEQRVQRFHSDAQAAAGRAVQYAQMKQQDTHFWADYQKDYDLAQMT